MEPRLSALVYGPSGFGKSWLGATTPAPRLIIDLEGRARYTPNGQQATEWDGISDPYELQPSPTRTYIVTVTDLGPLDTVYQWLLSGKHPFVSVDIDSLMFAQMRTSTKIRPGVNEFLREADWGVLLRHMERLVRDYHDLTLKPYTNIRTVVFLAGATLKDGFQTPLMQGQIAGKLPFLVDLAGYLDNVRDEDGSLVRQLVIEPYPEQGIKSVKDGTHLIRSKLGSIIRNPNFTEMYEALRVPREETEDDAV